jgi:tetratricopeptide (TPR) repeat protein
MGFLFFGKTFLQITGERSLSMAQMMRKHTLFLLVSACSLVFIGCGEKTEITFTYDRPAQYDIPPKVRRIAIVEFGGKEGTEKKWGEIASDVLSSALDEYNKKFHRYQLVDRKRSAAIMDERDFQMSVVDTDSAVKFGKIAKVDAMIYGTVYVTQSEKVEETKIPIPSGYSVRFETVKSTRYLSTAAITFTMDDVQTSKTICAVTVTRKYDSKDKEDKDEHKKDKGHLAAITQRLIEQCVEEFLQKISPHEETVTIRLEKGKSKAVKNGNNFAKEGEYNDAITMYKAGLSEKPDDYGAMFNIGVCHEALGELTEAHKWYDKALKYKADTKFIRARRRVRLENDKNGTG